jgi:predicted CXXCH cytochrome family protein
MVCDRVTSGRRMCGRVLPLCAALALLLGACSPAARYAALSLFFDGVPPPAPPRVETAAQPAALLVTHYAEHGPYAAKLCSACHESTAGNTFVAPRDQLCTHCHELLEPAKKFQHDPAASGECMSCHDPHSSAYRYLLVAAPNAVCASCHDKETLPEDDAHTDPAKACAGCHDPHQSDKEHLLR